MERLLFSLLIGWLSVSMSIAQVRAIPLLLTFDSLQKYPDIGYSLRREPIWLFHLGHDAQWADPTFDDRTWLSNRCSFQPPQAPHGWNGVGWFRLHFAIDSSLVGPALAMRVMQQSASEIYLDGHKIGSFGKIGTTPATNIDVQGQYEPLAFRFTQPGDHVLAVRLSARRFYFSRSAGIQQGFTMQIGLNETLTRRLVNVARVDSFPLALAFATGLFGLLHLILFISYPTRVSNLYYSGWLMLSTIDSVCAYLDFSLQDPVWQNTVGWLAVVVNFALAVTSVAFIYSVYYARQPQRIWLFYTIALLLSAFLVLNRSMLPYNIFFGFLLMCILEVARVIFLAIRRRQPGVWLIGVGVVVVALVLYAGPANQFGLWNTANVDSLFQQALFTTFGYLVLPLCTSIYLAQDVARTNRNLKVQLEQVSELSAKTLIQEVEKRELVAQQNEQLEQTVRQRTQQLQQQTDKLREMDGVKSRFFTNLTHEFRTPLTLMLGPAEQVLAQTREAATKQQVGLLQRNTQRLLRLINQLLELSKLEAGKSELALVLDDWVGLVKGTLHSFESMAMQKQISLHLTSDREELLMAMDRPKLENVLYNLFSNAIKFTPNDGMISGELTCQQDISEAWVELRVTDTGIGIKADKLPFLFDRFYQVNASSTGMPLGRRSDHREQEGTGIGLTLTKELVELHGGSIGITSQEGIGTTVTVRLPIRYESFEEVPSVSNRTLPMPSEFVPAMDQDLTGIDQFTTSRIDVHQPIEPTAEAPLLLLIEDNEEVRFFIRSSLGDGYRILEASNGEEGVHLTRKYIPDLVITDLMMPRLNGYQVCTTLKQDECTSHIPVIMLTARTDLDSKLEGLQTGADSYLTKPFHQRELLIQITNLLQTRQQLREYYSRETLGRATLPWDMTTTKLPSMEQVFLGRVRRALETHLDDEQYSVDRLCQEVGLGRTQLHRKLKALINQTPGDLLRVLRLQRAHDLLKGNMGTVAEVAYQVGFGNPANFSTSFSRHFGYPPSDVRKQVGFA